MLATIILTAAAGIATLGGVGHAIVIGYRIVRSLQATVDGLADLTDKFERHLHHHSYYAIKDDVEELRERVDWLQKSVSSLTSWKPIPPMRPPISESAGRSLDGIKS